MNKFLSEWGRGNAVGVWKSSFITEKELGFLVKT